MKEWSSRFNPFNSDKLLAQLDRWSQIKEGKRIPPPVLVTIDPTNQCNLNCIWCNSQYLRNRNDQKIDKKTLSDLSSFLGSWGKEYKVKAVCIAGGGEPTLHQDLGYFIQTLEEQEIKIGLVTNGTSLQKHYLDYCDWIGVSIDSGTPKTYHQLKGRNKFNRVIENIRNLTAERGGNLGKPGQGHGISYKYLLHPKNVHEVYQAAKVAKEIGCKNLHIRPVGDPWDRKLYSVFSYSDIELFRKQLMKARRLEDKTFKVFGITHKFDGDFRKKNDFERCYAIFMTADFLPPSDPTKGKFNLGLCCDRRGDKRLTLENLKDFQQVKDFWGSREHWNMFKGIDPHKCPRCTYQPHNIIYEKAIKEDNLTYEFI